MQRHHIMKLILHLTLTIVFITGSALSTQASELTQRDWMITLVDTLGWSYGLPDEPQDPDYINILTGNREFRFEAEDIYAQDEDNVSLMSFRNFGTFSGRGWLHGSREPTTVHLRFTLPIGGEYQLQGHLRQAGHEFAVGDVVKTVDADPEFTKVTIGSFLLQAGAQEIIVTLPPGGSIDYITLTAPHLAAISPNDGWQPDEPLAWKSVQTTLLQLLQLAELFPSNPKPLTFEAEDLKQTVVKVVDIPHLGQPSGGKWLRAGPLPAEVAFPINLKKSGFYDLSLRAMGQSINISIGGHQDLQIAGKSYLDNYTFKPVFLPAGKSNITVNLPPGGGVDLLTLTGRQIDTSLTNTLLGFEQTQSLSSRDLDTLTAQLAAFGIER